MLAAERVAGRDDNMSSSHFHDFYEIYFLESGERTYIIDDQAYEVHPGSLVLLPPYTMHYSFGAKGAPFCRLLVYFQPEALDQAMYEHLLHTPGVFSLGTAQQRSTVGRLLCGVLEEAQGDGLYGRVCAASGLALALAAVLRAGHREREQPGRDKMSRILRYIADHYMEEISLDLLSGKFFISKYFLCREFKKYTKSTVGGYVNSIRVLNAQRLFLESRLNLTQIAMQVGFSGLGNFERAFRKVTGMAPGKSLRMYRERAASKGN